MLFKDISYLQLWQPSCSAEYNHSGTFGRGHYEEQLCQIILYLMQLPFCFAERNQLCNFARGTFL